MRRLIFLFMIMCLLWSCSTTDHIPQDEVLYTGISEVAFNRPLKRQKRTPKDSTGVITAISNAYNSVEELLFADREAQLKKLPKEKRDSAAYFLKQDKEAYSNIQNEISGVVAFEPNGSFMGSSSVKWPVIPRLWLYNKYAHSTSRFGKWILENVAAEPIYVSTVNPKLRTQVAQTTLRNHGYFQGKARYVEQPEKDEKKARIAYQVKTGPLYHLDKIEYLNFPQAADSLISKNIRKTNLRKGDPFSAMKLSAERERLSNIFRNNGYYYFTPECISYKADTVMRPLHVQLHVQPSKSIPKAATQRYHMGRTRITLLEHDQYNTTDTLSFRDVTMAYNGKDGVPPLRMGVIRRFLFYQQGDLFNQDLQQIGKEKLSELGILSQLQVNYVPRDSAGIIDTLDVEVRAVLDKPYDAEFEGKITSKSNGQIGPGASFSMTKHNAFRNAETLGMKVWGSYEWQTGADLRGDRSLINSYEYGMTFDLIYPRMILGRMGKRFSRRANSSTQFQLNAKWMNRANYFGRVSLGARVNYSYQKKRNVKHNFTPLRLDYELQLHTTETFDSIMNANQALYVSMRDQFVPSMEYTYNWMSTRHAPRTVTLTLKEAGNLTSMIYRIAGEPFDRRNKQLFNVPFAQYMKATAQYTHLFRLTKRSGIATRIFGGAVLSYGNASIAPYNDLFTIGGANSIRAFAVRSIGPGAYHPGASAYSYIDQMGDLKIEANVEYRFPIAGNLYGATFLDAGNVWLMRNDANKPEGQFKLSRLGKDIALGTGAGLRYDLDFLVIRFDLGIGLHAPYNTGKNRYYNMPKFGKSLGYHLAVGYPF